MWNTRRHDPNNLNEERREKKNAWEETTRLRTIRFVFGILKWTAIFVCRSGTRSLRFTFGFRIYLSMHSSVITVWLMALVLAQEKWHHSVIVIADCPTQRTNGIRWTSNDGLSLESISWLLDHHMTGWNREIVKPLKMMNVATSLPNEHVRHWYLRLSFHFVRFAQFKVLVLGLIDYANGKRFSHTLHSNRTFLLYHGEGSVLFMIEKYKYHTHSTLYVLNEPKDKLPNERKKSGKNHFKKSIIEIPRTTNFQVLRSLRSDLFTHNIFLFAFRMPTENFTCFGPSFGNWMPSNKLFAHLVATKG